jgi:hypothetical protein
VTVWHVRVESVPRGQRLQILRGDSRISFQELFHLLESDPDFGVWYTGILARSEFQAYFWEHPPISLGTLEAAAEFVLLDSPALATLRADPAPFRSKFEQHRDEPVVTFPNLGGDAVLVVPRPMGPPFAYAHLAAFVRQAPPSQIECLWQRVGRAVHENLGTQPRWLSTAGMGVSWLHVRIDSYPKYYRFAPYRDAG